MHTPLASSPVQVEILDQGETLRISGPDGETRFHAVWLRDNGQDDNTRNPANGQKLITLQDIPPDTTLSDARVIAEDLVLTFAPDQWQTRIDLAWLWNHRYDRTTAPVLIGPAITTWDGSLSQALPRASYADCCNDPGILLAWLQGISRYGVAVLDDVPEHNAAVLDVIGLFGYVRETNYGPFFEIRSEIDPINLAYTNLGLQSHTDNPYRDPVPGLQFFGCLENNAEGGESVVVDGFRITEILHDAYPEEFELLSACNANFEYLGSSDTHLMTRLPIIERGVDGAVRCVRFNNRSCAALTDIPFEKMADYYRAYRRFGDLVEDASLNVTFKLNPRQLFVTDNTRVLHGRTGFSGSGRRWMQGAYADKDSLESRIRILQRDLNHA